MLRIVDMGKRTVEELEADAFLTEDPQKLKDIIDELADRAKALEDEIEAIQVKPALNRDLALAVQAFAEWQTAGYERDRSTRSIVGQQLWSEVAEHVRAVTGYSPEDVGAHATQLDLLAPPASPGDSPPRPVQQTLFALP